MFRQHGPEGGRCALRVTRCRALAAHTGERCRRRSHRHPVCAIHLRRVCGLRVGRSPGRGCGLFAVRAFRPGDALVPYTGERLGPGPDPGRPYVFAMPARSGGGYVDATCLRGAAGYANEPTRGASPPQRANVTARAFTAAVDAEGRPRTTALRRRFRHLSPAVAALARGASAVWFVATRAIAPGDEILLRYNDARIRRMAHDTRPSVC